MVCSGPDLNPSQYKFLFDFEKKCQAIHVEEQTCSKLNANQSCSHGSHAAKTNTLRIVQMNVLVLAAWDP